MGKGVHLRDFDLKTRMFRYPCSFMIYSDAFDGMPSIVKDRLYRRLFDVLSGKDNSAKLACLNPGDRQAILEIVKETKRGLPGYWFGGSNADIAKRNTSDGDVFLDSAGSRP